MQYPVTSKEQVLNKWQYLNEYNLTLPPSTHTQYINWVFSNNYKYCNTGLRKRISHKYRGVTLYPGSQLYTNPAERERDWKRTWETEKNKS